MSWYVQTKCAEAPGSSRGTLAGPGPDTSDAAAVPSNTGARGVTFRNVSVEDGLVTVSRTRTVSLLNASSVSTSMATGSAPTLTIRASIVGDTVLPFPLTPRTRATSVPAEPVRTLAE